MILYSGIPVSFTKHHVNQYTYKQLSSIFENRFDYYKVFDFIDNYIIDELFPETYKVSINIWTGTYEYFYLKLKDEFDEELLHLKVSPKNGFFYVIKTIICIKNYYKIIIVNFASFVHISMHKF